MATTAKTAPPAARIARAALACALVAALGLPPLAPLRASAADGPAAAGDAAAAPAQSIRVVPEDSEHAPATAPAPAQITTVVPEASDPAASDDALSQPDAPDAPPAEQDPAAPESPEAPEDPEAPETPDAADPETPADSESPDAAPDAAEPVAADASEAAEPAAASAFAYEGVWGGVAWTVDDAGLLRLAPAATPEAGYEQGQLPSKTLSQLAPWRAQAADSITSLQVDAGVKAVGESVGLFKDLGKLERVGQFHLDTSQATNVSFMFENCKVLAGEVDLSGCDTSQSTSMECLFNECEKLERVNLTGAFTTKTATSLEWMFHDCKELVEIEGIASFDTSQVTTTGGMFVWCAKLTAIDVSGWDVSSAQYMKQMFLNCRGLERLDLSRWNTKSATDFFQFFKNCYALKSVEFGPDFSTVNVGKKWWTVPGDSEPSYGAQGLAYMFYSCTSLKSLDVSSFDTTGVRNMAEMFGDCTSLTSITVGENFSWTGAWDPNNPQEDNYKESYFYYMLPRTTIADATFEGWRDDVDTSKLYPSGSSGKLIPKGARTLRVSFKIPDADTPIASGTCGDGVSWDIVPDAAGSATGQLRVYPTVPGTVGKLPDMQSKDDVPWYSERASVASAKVYPGVSADKGLGYMFYDCKNMAACDVSGLDTSNAANMTFMFYACKFPSLDLSSFDTSGVMNMHGMFMSCSELPSLDLSSFDTSAATDMGWMFLGCSGLPSLDLSSFDTSQVTDMQDMFMNCSGLASIDLSSFDTSQVENMGEMFYNCRGLASIDLSSFDTSRVGSMDKMFSGCASLASVKAGAKFSLTGDGSAEATLPALSGAAADAGDGIARTYKGRWFIAEQGAAGKGQVYAAAKVPATLAEAGWTEADGPAATWTAAAEAAVPTAPAVGGACGDGVLWDLVDGQLRIYPQVRGRVGKLPDMQGINDVPWYSSNSSVVSAKVYPGVAADKGLGSMFYYLYKMTDCDVSGLDTSNATSMKNMFGNCPKLASLDLSSFDTSQVASMYNMFSVCSSLASLDLSAFDVSQVESMNSMFSGCKALTSLDLSSFDAAKTVITYGMFKDCEKLAALTLPDSFKVTDSNQMFYNCKALASLDLSGLDTSSRNMELMFYNCKALASLDLSSFDTSGVLNMRGMFSGCSSLTSLDLSSFDTSAATDMGAMFNGCTSLASVTVGAKFSLAGGGITTDAQKAVLPALSGAAADAGDGIARTYMGKWFLKEQGAAGKGQVYAAADVPATLAEAGWTEADGPAATWTAAAEAAVPTSPAVGGACGDGVLWDLVDGHLRIYPQVRGRVGVLPDMQSASDAPWCDERLSVTNAKVHADIAAGGGLAGMFYYHMNMVACDVSGLDTSNATSMGLMFSGCSSLDSLDLSKFDTSEVANMSSMFSNCLELKSLDLSKFDTSRVTFMSSMFATCSSLASLDLSSFDTAWVTDMRLMFYGCAELASLDLKKFNIPQVADMGYMFGNCPKLASLDLSSFDTSLVADMGGMFQSCTSLASVKAGAKFSLAGGGIADAGKKAVLPALSGAAPDAGDGIARGYAGTWQVAELAGEPSARAYAPADVPATLAEAGWTEPGPATWAAVRKVAAPADAVDKGVFDGGGVGWYVAADPEAAAGDAPNRLVVYPVDGVRGEFTLSSGGPWGSYAATLRRAAVLPGCAVSAYGSSGAMFTGCKNMVACDVSGLDTSNAMNMAWMFNGCSKLPSLDLSKLDTSNAANMALMFCNCSKLESLDLSSFDTSTATGMSSQFKGCSALAQLKLPDGYIGPKVESATSMFSGCSSLVELPANLAIPDTLPQNGRTSMFYVSPPSGAGSKLATTYAGSDPGVLAYGFAADNRALDLTGVDATWEIGSPNAADVKASLFADGTFAVFGEGATQSFADADAVPWKDRLSDIESAVFVEGAAPADLSHWFEGATALSKVSALPASVVKMRSTFEGCTALESAPATVPASVADMSRAFYGCASLAKLASTFTFGAEGSDTTDCFHVDAEASGAPLDVRYEGSDERVLSYDWAGSNRRLVVGDMAGTVSIAGDAVVGGTLTTSVAGAPEGAEVSWRWLRAGEGGAADETVAGATGDTYTVAEADYGRTLKAEATAKKGNGAYAGSVSAATAKVAAPQVVAVVPEKLELSMDAAGRVSAAQMNIKNAGAYAFEVTALAPRLSDDAYPAGSWTLTGVSASSPDDAPASLLSARPFLKAADEAYALSAPLALAPGSSLDLAWTATFAPEGADALASLIAKADGTLAYGTFEPVVAYRPPAAA